jgi:CDP-diacylglycerol--serine O-phosphatidyltransferase
MIELFTHLLIVLVPLIFTSILHMLAVKENWLNVLQIPIWRTGFGENKTWRGVLFVPAANALFLLLISSVFRLDLAYPFLLGYILGLSYLIFELPNSFLKRKAGIKAGGHHRDHKYLFYILDKTDSSFGVTLTYFLITGITLKMALALFLINSTMHAAIAFVLVKLRIKSTF